MRRRAVLILAGGVGRRSGSEVPKQLVRLLGIPMLWWSVMAFRKVDPDCHIIIVLHPDWKDYWEREYLAIPKELRIADFDIADGGTTRAESVANGLKLLNATPDTLVAVHDAARPLVSYAMIQRGWDAAQNHICVIPAIPVVDSLREISTDGHNMMVDRSRFMAVQTPQIASAEILEKAYRQPERKEFTDDASRIEALGHSITLYDGDASNIKVTNPMDFAIAETLLKLRETQAHPK